MSNGRKWTSDKTRRTILQAATAGAAASLLGGRAMAQSAGAPARPVAGDPAMLTEITMTADGVVIRATLSDNPTSRDFLALLPLTMAMTRYGDREYYGKPASEISTAGPLRPRFENGDVAYWAPGRSFAIFFDKEGTASLDGLVIMGRITSDLDALKTMAQALEMRIERAA